jgi:bifunctional UDP-N-acetylglucosamine pyrophosphorylase/glucosamine-1-phosphate N-acetyltransferase
MPADPTAHLAAPSPATAVLLAAGLGTRMRSTRAKVLHPALGRPLVVWVAEAAKAAGLQPVVVVHHQEEQVRAAFPPGSVRFARQHAPRGTGDALAAAMAAIPEDGLIVVLCGDGPLIRAETLRRLQEAHGDHLVTVLTMNLTEPGSYGRLCRDPDGRPTRIVEASEASPAELAIAEVNTGIYAIQGAWLRGVLPQLQPHPPKAEIYLTDIVALAAQVGRAQALRLEDPAEALGVNDRIQLAEVSRILQARVITAHQVAGVSFEDPTQTTVESEVQIGQDTWVERGVSLRGSTRIGTNCLIGQGSILQDAFLEDQVEIKPYCVLENARVASGASAGPFARLRPGTSLAEGAKVGNFVELKQATIEKGAKVPHLSYVGDARVGAAANVGAGTITCNYDGFFKHHTDIGAGAFIGSNSSLVAPVRIGAGALVGAGSVITRDVPDDALAVARGEQKNHPEAARALRERKRAQKAATSGKGEG